MDIYQHFSCYENLPVRLSDVQAHVLETGVVASVDIFPLDIDPARLQGFCWQFLDKPKNSINHHRHAWVCYSKHLTPEMARLVVCKELLHLLDKDYTTAHTQGEVSDLIDQIVLPFEVSHTLQTATDHNGMLRALAVMMPACAIDALRPHVDSSAVSYETIAKLAGLPEHWVRLAFSPQWQKVLKVFGVGKYAEDSPKLDL